MSEEITTILNKAELFELQPQAEIVCMSDVEMKPIDWLWHKRIALGKLTVIAGQPGLGKSQLTAMLCANVTGGVKFADDSSAPIGSALMLSAEDDMADTIKPRLMAAQADLSKCYVLDFVYENDKNDERMQRSFDLVMDIPKLEDIIEEKGDVRLITIDPVSAYQGKTDSHGNAEVRALLVPLTKLAEKHNIAIVLVTHFNKSNTQEPIEKVIGSIGLVAAARAAYAITRDQENEDIRHFVPLKNNIGNDKTGFSFKIEEVILDNDIETSRISWLQGDITTKDAFNPRLEKPLNEADEFLLDLLKDGPTTSKEIHENREGAGLSKSSINKAKKRLRIRVKKTGFDGGWSWSLPLTDDDVSQIIAATPEGVIKSKDSSESSSPSLDL